MIEMRIRWTTFTLLTIGLISFSVAQTKPSEVKVTYTNHGSSLKTVFDDVSAKTGTKLLASAQYHELPLVIDVRDVTLKELMDKVARVCHAEWKQDSNGWWLVKSPATEKREAEEHYKSMVKAYRQAIADKKKELAAAKPLTQQAADALADQINALLKSKEEINYIQQRSLQDRMPAAKLAKQIATLLTPEFYASVEKSRRIVLTQKPNRMQKQLPKEAEAAIKVYVEEQQQWMTSLKRYPLPEIRGFELPGFNVDAYMLIQDRYAPEEMPAKTIVSVKLEAGYRGVMVEVFLVDAQGRTKRVSSDHFLLVPRTRYIQPKPLEGEKPFEFDEISGEFVDRVLKSYEDVDDAWIPPSKTLFDRLTQPERYDPISLATGKLFCQFAASKSLQAVACLTDSWISLPILARMGQTPSQILARALWFGGESKTVVEDEGWLLATWDPFAFSGSVNVPLKRSVMGPILRQVASDGRIGLEAKARIVLLTDEDLSPIAEIASTLIPQNLNDMMNMELRSQIVLQLHGSLSESQRTSLEAGSDLRLGQLTPYQQNLVHRLVYDDKEFNVTKPTPVDPNAPNRTWYDPPEPTEAFPNGLPSDLRISCKVTSGGSLKIRQNAHQSDRVVTQRYTYWMVANHLYGLESGNALYAQMPFVGFQSLDDREYLYKIQLSSELSHTSRLTDSVPVSGWVKTFEELPEKVRNEVKKLVEEVRKNPPPSGGTEAAL
ncbi:MAG: hypothetical protein KF784_13125 [Fimbriimonadaceae bacterium]|nr:hypothetical protein [Fimbriimonadaceae bacterium]